MNSDSKNTVVYRHVAGPGCGKTTQLLEFIKEEQKKGLVLDDMNICSFTRVQTSDLKRRICNIYPDGLDDNGHGTPKIDRYVKTFHGLALGACINHYLIEPSRPNCSGTHTIILQGYDQFGKDWRPVYHRFCSESGLEYDPKIGDPLEQDGDISNNELPIGNAFFSIYNLLKARRMPLSRWAIAKNILGAEVDSSRLNTRVFESWEQFKEAYAYLEHEDYVILATEKKALISPKVLIIDEFQDLSPSQYALYEVWRDSGRIERIYIAGDPDQSIYSFRGANPKQFIETTAEDHTGAYSGNLPVSYRCPLEIVKFSETILGRKSNMAPKCTGGSVDIVEPEGRYIEKTGDISPTISEVYKQYGDVLILCRFKRHVKLVSHCMSNAGIPHHNLSGKLKTWVEARSISWKKISIHEILLFIHAVESYFNGNSVSSIDTGTLKGILLAYPKVSEHLNHPVQKLISGNRNRDLILISDILMVLSEHPITRTSGIIDEMKFGGREGANIKTYLNAYVSSGNRNPPAAIRIDTIHQAKGLESKAVIILSAFQKNRVEQCYTDSDRFDEERRIYFVAATRASEHVRILTKPLLGGVVAPPLTDIIGA